MERKLIFLSNFLTGNYWRHLIFYRGRERAMWDDLVIERIREVRNKISEGHGHDTTRLIRNYQEMEKRPSVNFSWETQRKIKQLNSHYQSRLLNKSFGILKKIDLWIFWLWWLTWLFQELSDESIIASLIDLWFCPYIENYYILNLCLTFGSVCNLDSPISFDNSYIFSFNEFNSFC